MAGNSLQAVLNRAKSQSDAAKPNAPEAKPVRATTAPRPRAKAAKAKAEPRETRLIGGHFPPEVATQLRILAAEEDSTIQALLGEALDDLFVKKGKARIAQKGR